MTNGTSQGLLVIVAVIIFGIFVSISYLLFQDQLQTGLTSIFTDSIEQSKDSFKGSKESEPNFDLSELGEDYTNQVTFKNVEKNTITNIHKLELNIYDSSYLKKGFKFYVELEQDYEYQDRKIDVSMNGIIMFQTEIKKNKNKSYLVFTTANDLTNTNMLMFNIQFTSININ